MTGVLLVAPGDTALLPTDSTPGLAVWARQGAGLTLMAHPETLQTSSCTNRHLERGLVPSVDVRERLGKVS